MNRYLLSWMSKVKKSTCNYLNQMVKSWSNRKLKCYLFLFVLLGLTLSLVISFQAVKTTNLLTLFPRPHANLCPIPRSLPILNPNGLDSLLIKLRAYRFFLDSLSLHDTTKYQAILKSQPLIRDSLQALETLLSKKIK